MVGIWGIGFGISIWKSKCKERIFLDICQSGKTCREWISKQALELMEKFEIHNSVSVECNPFVQTPMVYGIRNPKVLLPTEEYTTDQLKIILLHELTHIKHKDIFWKLLCRMILLIYWFYPLKRQIFKAVNEWSEVYCDFSVINETGSKKGYFKTIYDIMIHQFQFQEYICAGIGECNLERRILIANNIRRMNTEKWIIGFILSMCFILFGGISVVTAMESMQLGYRILDRNTSEEIVVDGTPEVMNLVVHKRYGYDPRILHTKYLEDDGSIYGVDFLKKKERVQTRWTYLKKGQKVFFKVFDMTDKDTNKRKLEVGIRDFSNNIKYVNRSEEIDYKFSIEKSGKYQCFVSNYNDQNIELLGEIEILER
nr:M56 family metallopeptidase [uncultured Anaerostipes sp.]